MSKFIRKFTAKSVLAIIWCFMLICNLIMFSSIKSSAADPIVSLNKPVVLVNASGNPVSTAEIPATNTGLNVVDGNYGTFAQAVSTPFGAVIHLGGLTDVSSVSVTNYWANYITKFDIKGSADGVTWVTLASNITIGVSQTKLTTLSNVFSGRFIWVAPTAYSSSSWYCISEISVYGKPQPNYVLSANRTVTLVDMAGADIPAEDIYFQGTHLVDGNKTNYAQTIHTPFGAKIDLGGNADIAKIEVTNYWANYITNLDVKGSADGITWNTLVSDVTMTLSESKVITLTSVFKGRYIWIAPSAYSVSEWFCFSEISVYGKRTPSVYGYDKDGGRNFEVDGKKFVAFGIDLNSFESLNGNLEYLKQQMDANVEMNGNFVGIPVCWKTIEPTMNTYTYALIDSYIDYARSKGLKVSLMWHGSNYASGNNSFVPDYIINDSVTYTRNAGAGFYSNGALCPSNKNTLNREKVAYNNLLNHIRDFDVGKTVLCVATTSEINYMGGLKYPEQFLPPELDIRCECALCNVQYQNEGNVQFMEKQFSKYAKELYDYGALVYDLPSYSAVCANSWFEGWRYAENPNVLKEIVNSSNHIVVPSIANPDTIETFKSDMDLFTSSAISNNFVFVDGIDMGGHIDGKVECAPWISLLHYGGLGAIYWDAGTQNTATSIVGNTAFKNKLSKYFAPLKGMQFYLSQLKSSSDKFWWQAGQSSSNGSTSNFTFKQTDESSNDYGVAFEIAANECVFTGSTYGGSYTMEITRTGGFSGFRFEKGYFDAETGDWVKSASVSPVLNGDKATITVGTADAGLYEKSVYRFYDDVPPIVTGVTNGFKGTQRTITFNEGTALLNDNSFASGTLVKATGNYNLIVTDIAKNAVEINFSIVTPGDVNGDGEIDLLDLANIKRHLLKSTSLDGVFKEAGDLYQKGNITISDLIAVKKHILGIRSIG